MLRPAQNVLPAACSSFGRFRASSRWEQRGAPLRGVPSRSAIAFVAHGMVRVGRGPERALKGPVWRPDG
eukprot:15483052-Alexandrium_andersonii.AAC.1